MKKTALLIAGLFLVCNTVFAEEEKKEENVLEKIKTAVTSTKWDLSGTNVEFEARLYDSTVDSQGTMGTDSDLILKLKKQLDDKTWIYFKYDTDDENPDTKVEFVANRKFNEYLEAQLDLDILVADGISIKEDNDSDKVWIKYYPNDKYTIKVAPYDIGFDIGSEFETDGAQVTPGIQLDMKINDSSKFIVGLGAKMVNENGGVDPADVEKDIEGKDYTSIGYKLGYEYSGESMSLNAYFTGNTQDEKNITRQQAAVYDMILNVMGEFSFGNIGLGYEVAFQDLNETSVADETDFGAFVKLSYNIEDKNITPFISYRMVGEFLHFDDDDYSATCGGPNHGGLNSIILGADFGLKGGLTISPSYELIITENEVYSDSDGKATDTASLLAVNVTVEF